MKRFLVALTAALLGGGLVFWFLRYDADSEAPVSEKPPGASAPQQETAPPVPTATATHTTTSVNEETPAKFARQLEEASAKLPTLAQIRALPAAEVHHTPQAVIDAGAEIGNVDEAIAQNPALAPQGLAFYQKCAGRADLAHSVRAVCLSRLRELGKQTQREWSEAGIPASITRVADEMKVD